MSIASRAEKTRRSPASGRRLYRVLHFKKIPGTVEVYGAKEFVGTLDRAVKRLVKMYGANASVKRTGRGRYSVAEGAAEIETLR